MDRYTKRLITADQEAKLDIGLLLGATSSAAYSIRLNCLSSVLKACADDPELADELLVWLDDIA